MSTKTDIEYRSSVPEVRAVDDAGIVEGYVAVWDTVDGYRSSFQRGCFAKTLQERRKRVKVLWDHKDIVIGVPLELREDDHGLFVRIQLIMSVPAARDVFELVKAGAIDTFSFGFITVKDKWVNGVRVLTEVKLMEVSPTIFEANEAAVITGVRAMSTTQEQQERRSQKYQETYARIEVHQRGDQILWALRRTMEDIWYSDAKGPELLGLVDAALAEFTDMYKTYAQDLATMESRSAHGSPVVQAIRSHLTSTKQTPEQLAATTSLTLDEVRSLLDGQPAVEASKLPELPESVRTALAAQRADRVKALCNELRAGLEPAEVARIRGLLPAPPVDLSAAARQLEEFSASLRASPQP